MPAGYGLVLGVWGIGCGALLNVFVSGGVMAARKKLDVKYPNLYATPGFHKHADEFNSIQRGHQVRVQRGGLNVAR